MGIQVLVMFPLKEGEQLIEALEATGFEIKAAFWVYDVDEDSWQLFIASPLYDEAGPREAYARIQSALFSLPEPRDIDLNDVTVVSPGNKIVSDLAKVGFVKKGEPVKRIKNLYLGNLDVREALIYRLL